jgi:hypothetical protein
MYLAKLCLYSFSASLATFLTGRVVFWLLLVSPLNIDGSFASEALPASTRVPMLPLFFLAILPTICFRSLPLPRLFEEEPEVVGFFGLPAMEGSMEGATVCSGRQLFTRSSQL